MDNKTHEQLRNLKTQIEDGIKNVQNKFKPELEKIKKEIEIIEIPKRTKNEKFNKKGVIVSQLTDGRIIIRFMTLEESDLFYDDVKCFSSEEFDEICKSYIEKAELAGYSLGLDKWKQKSLWNRIFKK